MDKAARDAAAEAAAGGPGPGWRAHPRLSQGPVEDLKALQGEVARYDSELARRPAVVVATKMDLPGAQAGLRALRMATDLPVIPVCGRDGRNVGALAESLRWVMDAASAAQDKSKGEEEQA